MQMYAVWGHTEHMKGCQNRAELLISKSEFSKWLGCHGLARIYRKCFTHMYLLKIQSGTVCPQGKRRMVCPAPGACLEKLFTSELCPEAEV